METKQSPWRRPLVMYSLLEVAIFVIIGTIWWFGGEHSVERFSNISFFSGAVVMGIGILFLQGSRNATGSFGYQYAQTSNPDGMHERVASDWKERFAAEGQMLIFIGLGLVPVLVGMLASKIWG